MGETRETIRRILDLEESETLHVVAMEIDSATQPIYPLLYEIANNCFAIATQKSGCCVIQSCVESSGGELRDCIIPEILTNAVQLSEDQYGESFFDNREISVVAAANEVHLSSSCVSKSDGNGDKLNIVSSAMAPSSSSTGSTTTTCWCSG
ncbi:pumilio homolog 15-like [Solanum stenotomum]|uniref:pumilio homolog 15-like n=1 Tax=Solanum stenotomum TaxID=172797 RepID=UPI0020CFEFE6|nr:pumilio homolog 15-like [Solanum stenotomum]